MILDSPTSRILHSWRFTKQDYEYAKDVDGADWQSFLAETVELEKGQSRAQNVLNEKGQKIIYQSGE